jgi:5-methylcytosine-specific restriction endonuclease McrA
VHLTPALQQVAAASAVLHDELDARWSIVETSFDASIGSALMHGGVTLSGDGETLQASIIRRANVASARDALVGFQHGRCFYCHTPLTTLARDVHVDHVFPYAWMKTGSWQGPNLNAVWNLVVACAACNLSKSSRRPTELELRALDSRNEAIMASPHPLKRALQLTMRRLGAAEARMPEQRRSFLREVALLTTEGSPSSRRGGACPRD